MNVKYVKNGEIAISFGNEILKTEVGSCLAYCVWDRVLKIAGISHFSIPYKGKSSRLMIAGEESIIDLLRRFKKEGSLPVNLIVKIVGGAHVVHSIDNDFPDKNVEVAEKISHQLGIKITAKAVGGTTGYVLKFDTNNGELHLRKIIQNNHQIRSNPYRSKVIKYPTTIKKNSIENETIRKESFSSKTEHSPAKKISILIVDDSKVMRNLLKKMINDDHRFEIFNIADSAKSAEKTMEKSQPDVITLDINMPEMDGIAYLDEMLSKRKIPVIVISGAGKEGGHLALRAIESGAIDFMEKPDLKELKKFKIDLLDKLSAAFRVDSKHLTQYKNEHTINKITSAARYFPAKIILIGASTGGTIALKKILTMLPNNIPPILIVQHIPPGYSKSFAESLDNILPFDVKEAEEGDLIVANRVLIAPGGRHMKICLKGSELKVDLQDTTPHKKHCPAVDILFHSAVEKGSNAIAVILTGMGSDGADGMLALKNAGAVTIGQDEATSTVYGMPKKAKELDAITWELPLPDIPEKVIACASISWKTHAKSV